MTENLSKKPSKGILKSSSSFDTASCSGGAAGARRNSGVPGTGEATAAVAAAAVGATAPPVQQELSLEDEDSIGDSYVCVRKSSKTAKFDEMNILETYHPATKTYGHMKIEEPKTPFEYLKDEDDEGESSQSSTSKRRSKEINADELLRKLEQAKEGKNEPVDEVEEEESSEEEEDVDDDTKEARVQFESKRKAHYNEYYAVKLARKLMEEENEDDEEGSDKEVATGEQPAEEDDDREKMVTDEDG